MAVPEGPTDKRYTGNGVTKIFTIPFLLLAATDLDVFIDGVEISSGFATTNVGTPTSTITFTVAPVDQADIYLQLNVPFERLNDYQENGDFLSSTVNRDFDRIWQALKQLFRWSTRSLRLGNFDVDGAGWYRAKGNGIRDLKDPVEAQDASTKVWTQRYVGDVVGGMTGNPNLASNIFYKGPDGLPYVVQDMSSPIRGKGSALISYNSGLLNAITRTLQSKADDFPCVYDFLDNGEYKDVRKGTRLLDVTSGCQKFLDSFSGFYSPRSPRFGQFGPGDYCVSRLIQKNFKDVEINMCAPRFWGVSTDPQDGVYKLLNQDNVKITGSFATNNQDALNYAFGMYFAVEPGGESLPLTGGCGRIDIYNYTAYRAKTAAGFGRVDHNDLVCEITMFGMETFMCPNVIKIEGSQTGVSFVGGNLCSEIGNFAVGSVTEHTIWMEGGFATMVGGEMTHLSSDRGSLVRMTPCISPEFGNSFPTLNVGPTHIETQAPLVLIDNPRGISPVTSDTARLSFTGCQGFVGGGVATQPFIAVDTSGYDGLIQIKSNNFYSQLVNRIGPNIAVTTGASMPKIEVDATSFNSGFKHWLGGIIGGVVLHESLPIIAASNLANQAVLGNATATLRFSNQKTTQGFARYSGFYDQNAGVFATPALATSLSIRAYAVFVTGPSVTGRVSILRNGIIVATKYLHASDATIDLAYESSDVPAGTLFRVQIVNSVGGSTISFGNNDGDYLAISMATK